LGQSKKKYGLKARGFDKGGETKQVIKANDHNKMNEVANLGRNKRGIMDLGGGQVNIG
jgi:hypothetical protein